MYAAEVSRRRVHRGNRRKALLDPMSHLTRLAAAAASHGLLTGQIVFSTAFVGACALPNWIQAPRQVNACLERWMTVSALFFPSGMQTAIGKNQPALAPGRRGVFR
jgi:hypothetical protein